MRLAAEAFAEVDAKIATGEWRLTRNTRGEITFIDKLGNNPWEGSAAAKAGWCDGCLTRTLSEKGSLSTRIKLRDVGVVRGKQFVSAGHNGHGH